MDCTSIEVQGVFDQLWITGRNIITMETKKNIDEFHNFYCYFSDSKTIQNVVLTNSEVPIVRLSYS